jgi:hypothetical protein
MGTVKECREMNRTEKASDRPQEIKTQRYSGTLMDASCAGYDLVRRFRREPGLFRSRQHDPIRDENEGRHDRAVR